VQTLAYGKEVVTCAAAIGATPVRRCPGERHRGPTGADRGEGLPLTGTLMDDRVTLSCWGVMTWTVVALGGAILLANLLGGLGAAGLALN